MTIGHRPLPARGTKGRMNGRDKRRRENFFYAEEQKRSGRVEKKSGKGRNCLTEERKRTGRVQTKNVKGRSYQAKEQTSLVN